MLGRGQILQPVLTQIAQRDTIRKHATEQRGRGRRQDNLPSVRDRFESSNPIHRRPEIVPTPLRALPGMHGHPNSKLHRFRPTLASQRTLHLNCRTYRASRGGKRHAEGITDRLEHIPVGMLDDRTDQLIMTCQRNLHLDGMLLPEASRALNVREHQADRPRRKLRHKRDATDAQQTPATSRTALPAKELPVPARRGWEPPSVREGLPRLLSRSAQIAR